MSCEKLFPAKKWKSCNMAVDIDRVKDLKKLQTENITFFQRFKINCCLYTLHVAELPLLKWNVDNPHVKHIVEIYLAYLCHYMIYEYPNSEEVKNQKKRDLYRSTFSRHLEFLKKHWLTKTSNTGFTGEFIKNVCLNRKECSKFTDNFKSYLTQYLRQRRIPQDVLNSEHLDFNFYQELFEEYFTGLDSHNLISKWGNDDFLDPAYNKILVTTHTRPECDACVGFVCYVEPTNTSRRPKMQGIVSCPFYRAAFSNQEYILGSANTILHHMHEKLQGRLLEVDPISSNKSWKNRLSLIDFIVDTNGERIKTTSAKKRKRCLKSICESDSESDF